MKNILLLMILVALFSSCVLRHTDDVSDLGSNYYFLPDGKMSTICFNLGKEGEDRKGIELVDPKVIDYAFNENFIIAKSIGIYDKKASFWIIDKNQTIEENVSQYDSIKFYQELVNKGIKLKLNAN